MKRFTFLLFTIFLSQFVFAQSTFVSSLKVKAPKGATVYGIVECDGQPVEGVEVSDGYEVTVTDKKGCYGLKSEKHNGYVFITIPSCHEAMTGSNDMIPQFWAETSADASTPERHDFQLKKVDNRHHVMLAVTDIHLANMYDDMNQFKNLAMPAINAEVNKYKSQNIPVYTMCAGDSSFDIYWYDFLYEIADFRKTLSEVNYPTPFFNAMGNHDNDGATPCDDFTDFNATAKYRKSFGPTYYSVNIGDIHYIFLDNIIYLNSDQGSRKPGRNIAGKRDYCHGVTEEQIQWLKKDLALVKDKTTPVFVCMHCPAYVYTSSKCKAIKTRFTRVENGKKVPDMEGAARLAEQFAEFSSVHYVTGHTHRNITCYCKDDVRFPDISNIIDHNIGALSGAWWRTVAWGGVSLGPDSAPTGFEVFPVDGKEVEWYWTSVDDGPQKQFRTFDGNQIREYYRTDGEVRSYLTHYEGIRTDFSQLPDNRVFIHVWAWNPYWKVSVKENGRDLAVKQHPMENPQYTVAYYIPKTNWNRSWPQDRDYGRNTTAHFFEVQASAPDTTLEITVTDEFGHQYNETMIRPKVFSKTMK